MSILFAAASFEVSKKKISRLLSHEPSAVASKAMRLMVGCRSSCSNTVFVDGTSVSICHFPFKWRVRISSPVKLN